MEWIYYLLYYLYSTLLQLSQLCRKKRISFYLVANDGCQHPLTDDNLKLYNHLLVVYLVETGTKYRFHKVKEESTLDIKRIYTAFQEPAGYSLYAASLNFGGKVYMLDTIDFNVVGNELFTEVFNLWVSSNYFRVKPSADIEVTYIDGTSTIRTTKGPILFNEELLFDAEQK